MTQDARTSAAAELADHYIEIILSTEPKLLVSKVADEDAKDIAKGARNLAVFRQQLIDALAEQPLPDLEEDESDEDDSDSDSDSESEESEAEPSASR